MEHPDAYVGKPVTTSAGVERMLSRTVFLMDQRRAAGPADVKAIGKPLLVVAPYLTTSLVEKHYVIVRGQVVTLDAAAPARVAPGYILDLPDDVVLHYLGQPVLMASSVLDSTYAELTRNGAPDR